MNLKRIRVSLLLYMKGENMNRTNKRYSKDLKKKVVKLYLDVTHTAKELREMFDINDTKRIYVWTK